MGASWQVKQPIWQAMIFIPLIPTVPGTEKSISLLGSKEKAGQHEEHRKILHSVLRKGRATRIEGSFGTEKEHYGLKKLFGTTEHFCLSGNQKSVG